MRAILCTLLFLLMPRLVLAQAAVETCLHVEGASDAAAFERLVRSELERHPSHRAAAAPCGTELSVERIELDGAVYLTGRIVGQVPHRVLVEGKRVDRALAELLRVVLGNDPLVLRDPRKSDWFGRAMHGLRHRAHSLYGLEVGQRLAVLDGRAFGLPELSVHYRRELDSWQAGVRLDVAVHLDADVRALHPTAFASLLPEVAWFSSAQSSSAYFLSFGLGLTHQRFQGREPGTSRTGRESATGLMAALRTGVELLRASNTRINVHVDVTLPAFRADDQQRHIVDNWVPTFGGGVGASF